MIFAENIYKRYYLYRNPWEKVGELFGLSGRLKRQVFWALKNINFLVESGKTVGIIGPNGAGKSTLLKIITGITNPTCGNIKAEGRIAALLGLGTGFHPEFTGRQNIHINAKMLGLSNEEIKAKEDDIINFAEIGNFIDQPLRTYSSGMSMRLGFSIGVTVSPDIFIIDEVLSVGDAYFSQKCFRKLEEIKDQGTTILLVSHDMNAIVRLCDEAVLLDDGKIKAQGQPRDIIEYYTELIAGRSQKLIETPSIKKGSMDISRRYGNREAIITQIEMRTVEKDIPTEVFISGDKVKVRVIIFFLNSIQNPTVGILIRDRVGYDIFGTNTFLMHCHTGEFKAGEEATVEFTFDLNLGPNLYTITAAVHCDETHLIKCFDWIEQAYSFRVIEGVDFKFYGAAKLIPHFNINKYFKQEEDCALLLRDLFPDAPASLECGVESNYKFMLSGWFDIETGNDGRRFQWISEEAIFALCPKGNKISINCASGTRTTDALVTLFRLNHNLGTKRLEAGSHQILEWEIDQIDRTSVYKLHIQPVWEVGEGKQRRKLGILIFSISSQ